MYEDDFLEEQYEDNNGGYYDALMDEFDDFDDDFSDIYLEETE